MHVQVDAQLTEWRHSHGGAILDAVAAEIASATAQLHRSAAAAAAGDATAGLTEQPPPPPADEPGSSGQPLASAGQPLGSARQQPAVVAAALAKLDAINAQLQQVCLLGPCMHRAPLYAI